MVYHHNQIVTALSLKIHWTYTQLDRLLKTSKLSHVTFIAHWHPCPSPHSLFYSEEARERKHCYSGLMVYVSIRSGKTFLSLFCLHQGDMRLAYSWAPICVESQLTLDLAFSPGFGMVCNWGKRGVKKPFSNTGEFYIWLCPLSFNLAMVTGFIGNLFPFSSQARGLYLHLPLHRGFSFLTKKKKLFSRFAYLFIQVILLPKPTSRNTECPLLPGVPIFIGPTMILVRILDHVWLLALSLSVKTLSYIYTLFCLIFALF